MRKVTPGETLSFFMGAGAEAYSWYVTLNLKVEGPDADADSILKWDNATGWSCEFTMEDPEEEKTSKHTVDHAAIMRAVRKIAGPNRPRHASDACAHACKDLIFRTDDADFDAATADEVLQVAMFGEVVYG